jgi:hypothetical protein
MSNQRLPDQGYDGTRESPAESTESGAENSPSQVIWDVIPSHRVPLGVGITGMVPFLTLIVIFGILFLFSLTQQLT